MSANHTFLQMGANLLTRDPTILMVEFDSGLAVDIVDGHASRRIHDSDGYITVRGCWCATDEGAEYGS